MKKKQSQNAAKTGVQEMHRLKKFRTLNTEETQALLAEISHFAGQSETPWKFKCILPPKNSQSRPCREKGLRGDEAMS